MRSWHAALLGALVLAGCGDDDDPTEEAGNSATSSTEAVESGSDAPAGSNDGDTDSGGDDAAGGATASATIGTTVYAFVSGDGAFCRMDEGAGALSVSGLIDEATGAELTVDYSADSEPFAVASVTVDGGPDLESSAASVPGAAGVPGDRRSGDRRRPVHRHA